MVIKQSVKESKQRKKIKKAVGKGRRKYLKGLDSFSDNRTFIYKQIDLFGKVNNFRKEEYLKELSAIERTSKVLEDGNLGESADVVFDLIFDSMIDFIIDEMNADELVEYLSSFAAGEMLLGFLVDYYKSCPKPTMFSPPVEDFMKSFSVDVCDPEFNMKLPRISLPSLSLRYNLLQAFSEGFKELILSFFSDLVVGLIKRVAKLLEDLICKTLEALGTFVANELTGKTDDDLLSFQNALDAAFCGS